MYFTWSISFSHGKKIAVVTARSLSQLRFRFYGKETWYIGLNSFVVEVCYFS